MNCNPLFMWNKAILFINHKDVRYKITGNVTPLRVHCWYTDYYTIPNNRVIIATLF